MPPALRAMPHTVQVKQISCHVWYPYSGQLCRLPWLDITLATIQAWVTERW
jgi:hypothetical protein